MVQFSLCLYWVRLDRMSHRKWRATKHHPSRVTSSHQISCCLVSLRFLCDILSSHSVGEAFLRYCRESNLGIRWCRRSLSFVSSSFFTSIGSLSLQLHSAFDYQQLMSQHLLFYGVLCILPLSLSHSLFFSDIPILLWQRLRERVFPRFVSDLAQIKWLTQNLWQNTFGHHIT